MFYTLTNTVMNLHNLNRLYTQRNDTASVLPKEKLRMPARSFTKALFFKKKKKDLHFSQLPCNLGDAFLNDLQQRRLHQSDDTDR